MTSSLRKIKRIKGKSLKELRLRSEQALAAYAEQFGLSGYLPDDTEFWRLVDKKIFGEQEPDIELWRKHLQRTGQTRFFPGFASRVETMETFLDLLGEENEARIIQQAENLIDGKFNLLGFGELDFGVSMDWHFEPRSKKRTPLKHWLLLDELETAKNGDLKIIWELNRHQHFFTLGTAYWLTSDERYAAIFVMHLCSWMEQNPPSLGINWSSNQEVAYRAISWIWAFQFFLESPALSSNILRDALKFLYLHARHIETYLSTYTSPNTHLIAEAFALYCLGTFLPEFKQSSHWRKLGKEILLNELDRQILPDGVHFELSTWHHRQAADFYIQFLLLSRINGDKFGRGELEKVEIKIQKLLDFLMFITRPDRTTPLLGDDDGGRILPYYWQPFPNDFRVTLAHGAVLFKREDYKFIAEEFCPESIWLFGMDGVTMFDLLDLEPPSETSKAFPDGGCYVIRDDWSRESNFMLLDGGKHGVLNCAHAHADALSFELAMQGKTVLVDSGTYSYYESKEARNYFRSTFAHNTLSLDNESSSEPDDVFSWKETAQIDGLKWVSHDRFDFFEARHDGFSRLVKDAAFHQRSVFALKENYFIIRDGMQISGTHRYDLNFHFDANTDPRIRKKEGGSVLTEKDLKLVLYGDNGRFLQRDDWIAPIYGACVEAPSFSFASVSSGPQEFFTFLFPGGKASKHTFVYEIETRNGRAFTINYDDYKDIFAYSDGNGEVVRTKIFDTDFHFAWLRFSAKTQQIVEAILVGGRRFLYKDREIVNYPNEIPYAIARRTDHKMEVSTADDRYKVSLPQRRSTTYVLKTRDKRVV
jgi:hypothetical protein